VVRRITATWPVAAKSAFFGFAAFVASLPLRQVVRMARATLPRFAIVRSASDDGRHAVRWRIAPAVMAAEGEIRPCHCECGARVLTIPPLAAVARGVRDG
jgi:hypothetical protein